MALYGDRGNAIALQAVGARCGLDVQVHALEAGEEWALDFDLLILGGGQDFDQSKVTADLLGRAAFLKSFLIRGGIFLGICGGYQLLGASFRTQEGLEIPCLGLCKFITVGSSAKRLVGNLAFRAELGGEILDFYGFENHSGRTDLQGHSALGKVTRGHGNNGLDQSEGVYESYGAGLLVGTYAHGFLPRNPLFTKHLLEQIVGASLPFRLSPFEQASLADSRRG